MNESGPKNITVVGAGIVGICCALYLQRDGHRVTLIDRDGPGEGASYGNAGIFSAGSVHPEATPGFLKKATKMLLDPMGPATIRPTYLPKVAPFVWRMLQNSSAERAEEISKSIVALSEPALDYYKPLLEEADCLDVIRENGCLYIYETEASFAAGRRANAYRDRRNVTYEYLSADELRQMAPALGNRFAGAIYVPQAGHSINPLRLSQSLATSFQRNGGKILRQEVKDILAGANGAHTVVTNHGNIAIENVVVAAGAYSRFLAKRLSNSVPLETERGYHAILPKAELELAQCLLIPDRGIAVTPMETGLRIAGTVEFAGLYAAPNYKRADILVKHASELFPGLDVSEADKWMGHRPSIPDSLPVISKSAKYTNAFFAFGHGHLGLTQAAITGRLIADLVAGKSPTLDVAPFRVDRF